MVDVVYILGTGSKWQDNEIRFSLRSITKYLSGIRKVWIVGELPCFIDDTKVEHLYCPDRHGRDNADANMIEKILYACKQKGLSEDFLFMNDDFFILRPLDVADIPILHNGDLKDLQKEFWNSSIWRLRLKNTFTQLTWYGMSTTMYDIHAPMMFNKHLFPAVMNQFNYQITPGLNFRSLYGNAVYEGKGTKNNGHKVKAFRPKIWPQLEKETKTAMFFAVNDTGLNIVTKAFLRNNYTEISDYEHKRDYLIKIGRNCNEFS